MTTRSQKRKAVADLVSGDFEASLTENNSTGNLIPSSSKNLRLEFENLEEIKTTLRKEIMTDLTKILAENQKEMLKLIAPANKKRSISSNIQDSDSEQENISVTRTSTPVKTQTATSSKTTPVNSRNINSKRCQSKKIQETITLNSAWSRIKKSCQSTTAFCFPFCYPEKFFTAKFLKQFFTCREIHCIVICAHLNPRVVYSKYASADFKTDYS